MKKLYVALGILVVLAAAFFGYYQYLKSSLLTDLDELYIPAAEQMLKEQTGQQWHITYKEAKADGLSLLASELAAAPKDAPKPAITMDKLTLSFEFMSLLSGEQSMDIKAEDLVLRRATAQIEIKKVKITKFTMEDAQAFSFKQLEVDETSLSTADLKEDPLEIKSAEFEQCRASINSVEKNYLLDLAEGEMVFGENWVLTFDDFSTKSVFSGVLFPPPGTYFAKLKQISLKKQGKEFISVHNLNTVSEAAEGRIDSTMELEQFIVKPVVEIGDGNAVKEWFDDMGYEELNIGVSGKASMIKEGDVLDMPEMVFTMAEAGQLTFSARMLGFLAFVNEQQAKGGDEDEKETASELADQLKLAQLGVKYVDHSLLDRIARLLTKGGNDMKPEDLRLQWAKVMQIFALQATNDNLRDLYKAVSVFLQDPKNIELTMQPAEPVTISKLVEVGWPEVLDVMNLKARANMDD